MYLKSSLSIFSFSKKGDNTCTTIRNSSLKAFVNQILKLQFASLQDLGATVRKKLPRLSQKNLSFTENRYFSSLHFNMLLWMQTNMLNNQNQTINFIKIQGSNT